MSSDVGAARRSMLWKLGLMVLVAVVIVVFEVLNDWSHALVHGAALVLPPFFTLLAFGEQRRA